MMGAPVRSRFCLPLSLLGLLHVSGCEAGPSESGSDFETGASTDWSPSPTTSSGASATGPDGATVDASTGSSGDASGGASSNGSTGGTIVADEACGNDLFDELALSAHRANALRSQTDIDSVSMGNGDRAPADWLGNDQVRYDDAWGSAVFNVPKNANGTDLITDLYPRLEFDGPPTDTLWVVSWMTRWGPNWLSEAHKGSDRSWRNSKHVHLRGRDDTEPDGDGALKQNVSFMRPESRRAPDELMTEFGETRAGYLGPNATDAAPIQPASFGTFPIRVERWVRHVLVIQEGAPYGTFTSWLVDTARDAVRVVDAIDYRVPWSAADGVGLTVAQIFLNPKPAREDGPGVQLGFKNFIVLRNPSDVQIDALLLRPHCD